MEKSHTMYIALSLSLLIALPASAQIQLNSSGHVGIGTPPHSQRNLNLECDGCGQSTSYGVYNRLKNVGAGYGIYNYITDANFTAYGVYSFIDNIGSAVYGTYNSVRGTTSAYGLYGNARVNGNSSYGKAYGAWVAADNSNAYWNFGIYARGMNASNLNRGIYAIASGNDSWAGYFVGNVYSSSGIWDGSDERFKKEIQGLDTGEMLERIGQIQPRRYRILNENELRQSGMPVFSSKEGEHFGVVAQELEAIFPELVIDKISILNEDLEMLEDSEERKTVMTKAVNYNGLIPVLIAGIQEQQQQIMELEARLTALENLLRE